MTSSELNKLYWLKKEFHQLKKELNELREYLQYRSVVITDMPKSTSYKDTIGDYVSKIDMLEEKIKMNAIEIIAERHRLEDYISSIDDSEMRVILRLRHVDGKTWQEIGNEVNLTESGVYRKYHKKIKKCQVIQGNCMVI